VQLNTQHPTCNITSQFGEWGKTEQPKLGIQMNCPNCGSTNHSESEVCIQCGGALAAGKLADKAAAETSPRVLLEQYYSGRRNTIVGVLLLCGACLALLALMSKGLPPFLAFLWTCWMFLWGVISLAEGAAKWLSSHRQIEARAGAGPGYPRGSGTETDSDQAGPRSGPPSSRDPWAESERPIETPVRTLFDKAQSG
jgi:hypothetical protein